MVQGSNNSGQVRARIHGEIGDTRFERCWCYWEATDCMLPLIDAMRIYNTPEGRLHVRVDGSCACEDPSRERPVLGVREYVNKYHVFSKAGLKILADAIRSKKAPIYHK